MRSLLAYLAARHATLSGLLSQVGQLSKIAWSVGLHGWGVTQAGVVLSFHGAFGMKGGKGESSLICAIQASGSEECFTTGSTLMQSAILN